MYQDAYSKDHVWIRDGKPHWAYNTRYLHWVSERKAIEWTPNTIASKVAIDRNRAKIKLNSNTPNLKTYQMKDQPNGDWKDVSNSVEVELKKNKNEMIFHTMNLAGVSGPEHTVIIER